MKFKINQFSKLTNLELYKIIQLRQKIFVVEQNCIYEDLDDLDQDSMHIMGFADEKLACYARVLHGKSYDDNYMHIGRVVVDVEYRSKQIGHELMEFCINYCLTNHPNKKIKISAQEHLQKFYNKQGFVTVGSTYLEDNIPHVAMIRNNK